MIDGNRRPDRQKIRHGSSSWADEQQIRKAGLFGKDGLFVGYHCNNALRLKSDAPGIVIAGSGSGKGRDWLIETIIRGGQHPMLVFDPKGELAAVTIASFLRWKAFVYLWNPCGLHGMPQHKTNPLDILTLANPMFHSDCTSVVQAIIPMSHNDSGTAQYFAQRAREWVEGLLKALVERHGFVTFPMLWRTIQSIQSNPQQWIEMLGFMDRSAIEQVRNTATDIWGMQQKTTGNEFTGILGTMKANLNFLNDPTLCAALENPDFSLKDLTSAQLTSLFVMVPRDFISQWGSVLRTIFLVASKYKARAPQARRITMLIDEAGRMGNFEALLEAYAIGRGEGTRVIALFQDIGQIERNFGRSAISGFLGSAQWRAFFGVREHETARLISLMLGEETLEFDDRLQQEEARRKQWQAFWDYIAGGDPMRTVNDFNHFSAESRHRKTMSRALMKPDEILRMPENQMISFISGLDLPPILANKYPYYTTRSLNGLWLPNPYHPPLDRVTLPGVFWSKTRRVITMRVPEELAHYPQYSNGLLCRIERQT